MVASRRARRTSAALDRLFNPLHCGAVVASPGKSWPRPPTRRPSIPFIAGQWSLLLVARVDEPTLVNSIPFIAGQWSLLTPAVWQGGGASGFQSPSLRGSGRFSCRPWTRSGPSASIQSPSLRGSGRFERGPTTLEKDWPRFNPLHCGAVVASAGVGSSTRATTDVSIPFIAGQWSLRAPAPAPRRRRRCVSIPFIAGQWSLR